MKRNDSIYVFEWVSEDATGELRVHEFSTQHELASFLNDYVQNMEVEAAKKAIDALHIIQGDRLTPNLKEVVKKVVVEFD